MSLCRFFTVIPGIIQEFDRSHQMGLREKADEFNVKVKIRKSEEQGLMNNSIRSQDVQRVIGNLQDLCEEAAKEGYYRISLISMDFGTFEIPQPPDHECKIYCSSYHRLIDAINNIDGANAVIVPVPVGEGRRATIEYWIGAAW